MNFHCLFCLGHGSNSTVPRISPRDRQRQSIHWNHIPQKENQKVKKELVPEGLEPSTLTLLALRSNQLSYGTRLIYRASSSG
ncbi:hypothetical protein BP00DRAFT_147195 [Aspergillus indologenus CBS 114.80]|uniref:Uncharacterized protein n=1 Tax=Aspergillus indologenus CBS 114.80 TaxID=1450541 RepID=A0A2V5J4T2_9EURO|nr:hypothetical protein BP00DRAFT_147195 [Aspergillus indologenus CBS 114.80]